MKYIFLSIAAVLVLSGCHSGPGVDVEEDLNHRLEKGKEYLEKQKYSKAQEELDFIVMNNPGSREAVDAQFYLGEALYHQKKYPEATVELERYIRYSHDLDKIALARFRICECAVNSSYQYQKDQTSTLRALSRLQGFIEDYPSSSVYGEYVENANAYILEIRNKLARKEFENGRLYLKLEEYESARIYFEEVLFQFYDTDYADEARLAMMFSYILEENHTLADQYFKENSNRFNQPEKRIEAEALLERTADGKLTFEEYIRLLH